MPSRRLVCLHVPLFPLAARLRSQPELEGEKLAVFTGNGHLARVAAATRPARQAGLKPGMTLPQARALIPRLAVYSRDPECERSAQEGLLEIAESFSPRVEDAGEGAAYLDASGLELHYSSEQPEHDLGRALMGAGEQAGLPVWVGIASAKLAARVAAEIPDSPIVVPDGEEADFLAPLPLARLSPEVEVAETLTRWGIRSIGDLARLPKNEVSSRLGSAGRILHQEARGLDARPLIPYQPPPSFREGMELEWPLVNLEPLLFVARSALDRLVQRMATHGLACSRIEISLRLEPDGHHQRGIDLPAPTRDVKTLLTLIRLDLENHPPRSPVVGYTLTAHPDTPREAQLSLLGPASLPPDRLAATLARLFSLLGPERSGSPRVTDGYRPEAFSLVDYEPPPPPKFHRETAEGRGLLAVRVLRPPVPLEVVIDPCAPPEPSREDRPLEILTVVRDGSEKRPPIQGRVKVASGPWNLEQEWWSEDAVERDYWDVELAAGGVYRLFRECRTGDWFADGIYD